MTLKELGIPHQVYGSQSLRAPYFTSPKKPWKRHLSKPTHLASQCLRTNLHLNVQRRHTLQHISHAWKIVIPLCSKQFHCIEFTCYMYIEIVNICMHASIRRVSLSLSHSQLFNPPYHHLQNLLFSCPKVAFVYDAVASPLGQSINLSCLQSASPPTHSFRE